MARRYQKKGRRGEMRAANLNFPPVVATEPERPVRGVKLKTVSNFVMVVSILCLLAFSAGRTPLTAAGAAPSENTKGNAMFLGLRTAKYSARDLTKAKEWYRQILGKKPYFDQPFYVGFNVGGYELGITPDEKVASKRAEAGIAYWGVDDARATYKKLLDAGATPFEDVQDVGDGILIGSVHDPFGNLLGVIQNPHFKIAEK